MLNLKHKLKKSSSYAIMILTLIGIVALFTYFGLEP